MDPKDQLDFLWKTHSYLNDYVRFADGKGTAVAVSGSALIAGLYAAKVHERFAAVAPAQWGLGGIAAILAFALLTMAVLLAFWAIKPRLWNKQETGFLFWESIVAFGRADQFWTAFSSQQLTELALHLCNHVFALALVCHRKYVWVSASLWLALIGGLLGAFLMIVR